MVTEFFELGIRLLIQSQKRFKSGYRSGDRKCFYRYYHSDNSQRYHSNGCLPGSSQNHNTDVRGDKSDFRSSRRILRLHFVARTTYSCLRTRVRIKTNTMNLTKPGRATRIVNSTKRP